MTVQALPLVGTSWYERGFSYWVRRIGIGAIFLVVVVIYPAMIEGALQAISAPGTALYDGLAAAEIVFTIVTGAWFFLRSRRNSLNGVVATRKDTRASRAGAASVGPVAFATGGVVAGLLVFLSLLTSGLVLAVFVTWILPTPPAEQYQRGRIAERLRIRHDLDQLSPRSKHYGSKNHHKA